MPNLQITFPPVARYEFKINGLVLDRWQTNREQATHLYSIWVIELSRFGATCTAVLVDTSTGETVRQATLV